MSSIAHVTFFSLLALVLLPMSESTAADNKPTIESLIEQLGSTDFAQRERAARMLQARGPAALPALRKAKKHPDAEVRRRVLALIPSLEIAAALAPKRVTLGREPRTLTAIFQEIEKQTGYPIGRDDMEDGKLYRIEMKDLSFWEAMDRLGRETDRVVGTLHRGYGVLLNRDKTRSPFVAHRGSFRMELQDIGEVRHLDFTLPGKGKQSGHRWHRLTLSISLLAEPRFIFLDAKKANVQTATYEEGEPLGAPAPLKQVHYRQAFAGMFPEDFVKSSEILLQRPSMKTTAIKCLRGTIPVQVAVERKRVAVVVNVLKAKGAICRVSEGKLEITEVKRDKKGALYLRLRVPPAPKIIAAHWHKRIHLEDAEGHPYESNGGGSENIGNQIIAISLRYPPSNDPKAGPPSKLIVEDWSVVDYAIPFEFKDIPLP